MEKELWKLKFKERYAKKEARNVPAAPPPTPVSQPPVIVQVPEQRKAPSDAASLARDALALATFGATPPSVAEQRPYTKPHGAEQRSVGLQGFGGYGRLF